MDQRLITELVIANRILAREDVVDAYGHVSIRDPENPGRYYLSCSRAPALVEPDDIMQFDLESAIIGSKGKTPYLERFIHGAIYEARPDVIAVVHAHAEDTLPFGIAPARLKPVIHSGAFIGAEVPVWDIARKFGDKTNLLVTNVAQGISIASHDDRLVGTDAGLEEGFEKTVLVNLGITREVDVALAIDLFLCSVG